MVNSSFGTGIGTGAGTRDTSVINEKASGGTVRHRRTSFCRFALPVRVTRSMAEGAVLLLVVALAIVYAGAVIGERLLQPRHSPIITITVEPGDTLWSLADRYGSPNDYILRRVDRLATFNGLEPGKRLQTGQVIQVPVENPAERQRILVSNGSAR